MIAVIVRLAISDRENKALLEQVRTDPLTGLGQPRRAADRPRRSSAPRRPTRSRSGAALRPQRLQALQRHLRPPRRRRAARRAGRRPAATRSATTASPTGSAATSSASSSPASTATRRRADPARRRCALDARARTASTSTPPGARRRFPPRPTTPREAMQLADVRMYAQKESRRASRADERTCGSSARAATPSRAESRPGGLGVGRVRAGAQRRAAGSRWCARPRPAPPPGPRRGRRASPPRRARPSARGRAAAPAARRSRPRRSPPAGSPRSGRGRAPRRSRASGPSRAPRGRRAARSAAPRGSVQARRNISAPARIASSGAAGAGVQRPGRDPLGQLRLDLLVDGLEELALAVEVVVEGAARDPGRAHDLLGADLRRSRARRRAGGRRRPGRRGSPRSARPGCVGREPACPAPTSSWISF